MTERTPEGNLDYGRAVRTLREEREMTLEALADAAGVSASYLSEVERGLKRPSTDVVAKIAEAFGMPPSGFLEYIETLSGRDVTFYMKAGFESLPARMAFAEARPPAAAQAPKPQEPGNANLRLLMSHARQLDERDLKTLVDLARRLLRKGK